MPVRLKVLREVDEVLKETRNELRRLGSSKTLTILLSLTNQCILDNKHCDDKQENFVRYKDLIKSFDEILYELDYITNNETGNNEKIIKQNFRFLNIFCMLTWRVAVIIVVKKGSSLFNLDDDWLGVAFSDYYVDIRQRLIGRYTKGNSELGIINLINITSQFIVSPQINRKKGIPQKEWEHINAFRKKVEIINKEGLAPQKSFEKAIIDFPEIYTTYRNLVNEYNMTIGGISNLNKVSMTPRSINHIAVDFLAPYIQDDDSLEEIIIKKKLSRGVVALVSGNITIDNSSVILFEKEEIELIKYYVARFNDPNNTPVRKSQKNREARIKDEKIAIEIINKLFYLWCLLFGKEEINQFHNKEGELSHSSLKRRRSYYAKIYGKRFTLGKNIYHMR